MVSITSGFYNMDAITLFGLVAVTAMLIFYALEDHSPWFILAFAGACVLASVYGFLQGAWPFGIIEAIWAGVAAAPLAIYGAYCDRGLVQNVSCNHVCDTTATLVTRRDFRYGSKAETLSLSRCFPVYRDKETSACDLSTFARCYERDIP